MTEPTFQEYLSIVWRRRLVAAAVLVLIVGCTLAWSLLQTPRYRASADLLVTQTASQQALIDSQQAQGDAVRRINNEVEFLRSAHMRDAAAQQYDGPLSVADVRVEAASMDADVVEVSVTAADPGAAATLTNHYVDTYLANRRQMQVDDLLATVQELQPKIDALNNEITAKRAPLDAFDQRIATADSQTAAALREERASVAAQVEPQISSLQAQENFYRSQLDQLGVNAQLAQSGNSRALSTAEAPEDPISPDIPRNLMIATAAGLVIALGGALVLDRMDDSVKSTSEVESISQQPTLAVIPRVAVPKGEKAGLVSLFEAHSPAAEAYRSLRTAVRFLSVDEPVRSLQVTSANAGEGKTFTAANLAIAMAQAGQRVLLVDADLRRPRLHSLFGAPSSPGLTTLLLDDSPVTTAIYMVEQVVGLHLLPSGEPPPNPSELLSGPRASATLERLQFHYDIVVIDCPPILPVSDAQVLSRLVDLTVVVVADGKTSRRGLQRTIEVLSQVEAPVGGTVLNQALAQRAYGLHYAYRYPSESSDGDAPHNRVVQVSPVVVAGSQVKSKAAEVLSP